MGQILVRDLEDEIIQQLKREARSSQRSLEAQVRTILASWVRMGTFRDFVAAQAATTAACTEASSAEIVRQSRDGR